MNAKAKRTGVALGFVFTHVGFLRSTGYVHGPRLYGHRDYYGKRHALSGGENIFTGAAYRSACGKTVNADHDGEKFNVWEKIKGMGVCAGVTCKRCRMILCETGQGIVS